MVRYLLAGNPAAPVAVLARLSQDACPSVRAAVAANPSTLAARRVARFYLGKSYPKRFG